jgi:predicted TIM-barrel fold metal-dependent hydrolase
MATDLHVGATSGSRPRARSPISRCAAPSTHSARTNVMYSVDYPFESMTEAAGWLDAAKLDPAVRAKVEHQDAQALLKLHQPAT